MLGSGTILVVGNLKVGKSTIFSHLVGRRRQRTHLVDTPGFYSLQDRSEDAGLARKLLTGGQARAALLVLDSKNLARRLKLFLELAEYDIPVTVALNMCDEARQRGVEVDVSRLSEILGVEVVPTVATEGRGLGQLRRALAGARRPKIELEHTKVTDEIRRLEAARVQAEQLASKVVTLRPAARTTWKERLEALSRKPASGIPIAVLVLFATYMFVGWFGAGILVDLLEGKLFGEAIIPWLEKVIGHIPWQWLRDLLVGPFGLLTVGLVLSLAIVLPVLATFFFAFALMEDSGYLPRLSLLTDRVLRKLGLNGKGVLPLVMGLSCVTMAVLSARVLDSPKQRIIATLLLVLTVPCAPLLAVMMVLLARLSIWATVVFFGLLLVQFFIVGALANLLIPGKRPDFVLELPPMRVPRIKATLQKTGHQIVWFLKEAIPYFLLGTFVLFLLDQFGILDALREGLQPVSVKLLGLREESADVFFMTVVRREAGAALLAQQSAAGMYDGVQVVVTLMVMTLMIPCINSVLVMYKERGFLVSSAILLTVIAYSLLAGGLIHFVFRWLGVQF
jgi:ferrous iron transport protein B